MKVLLICLLFVNSVYTMQEEKLSHPSEIIRSPHPHPHLPAAPELERHHHTKKSITITVDDRDGNSPAPKIPCCSSKVKIAVISASALVVTSGLSAFIAWQTKNCGN